MEQQAEAIAEMDITKFAILLKSYADDISEIESSSERFPGGYTSIDI